MQDLYSQRIETLKIWKPSQVWVKTFTGQAILNAIYPTTDGGFIAVGRSHSRRRDYDAWIVKFNGGGKVQWQRGVGDKDEDEFYTVLQTSDNGYLASGKTVSEKGEWLGLIVRLTPEGTVQWQKTVPGTFFKSLLQTAAGDFILTGGSTVFGAKEKAFVIVQLGPSGQRKWEKVYGEGEGRVIKQTSDGGYFALGSIWGLGRYETLILKIDFSGTAQWQKQYRGSLNAVEQSTDGGFLLAGGIAVSDKDAGNPYRFGPGNLPSGPSAVNVQGWLLKLDHQGDPEWQKQYGGVFGDEFITMRKTRDGHLIVLGNTMNFGSGGEDVWLLQLDERGAILWQKAIGGPSTDFANDLQPAADGGYIIAGTTLSFGPGSERALLAKVDHTGNIPCCALPAVSISNSVVEGLDVSASKRPFPTEGQAVSIAFSKSSTPFFDLAVPAASIWPSKPRLIMSSTSIEIGPTSKNTRNRIVMKIMNAGAADLIIKEIQLTNKLDSQAWSNKRSPFSVTHGCTNVEPSGDCTFTVEFNSPTAGLSEATLTIISNDPDAAVLSVPVRAMVLQQ